MRAAIIARRIIIPNGIPGTAGESSTAGMDSTAGIPGTAGENSTAGMDSTVGIPGTAGMDSIAGAGRRMDGMLTRIVRTATMAECTAVRTAATTGNMGFTAGRSITGNPEEKRKRNGPSWLVFFWLSCWLSLHLYL